MKLEQWTLFIDMLGYGKINGNISNEEEALDFINFMRSNVKIFEGQDNEEMKKGYEANVFNLYKYYDIKVIFVSDSLMITYYPKEVDEELTEEKRILHSANTLFIIIQRLQAYIYNCMKEKRIVVRGGISSKFTMIADQFAVGIGIIEAYLLESKKAIYPRIILSDSITSNVKLMKAIDFISLSIYKRDSILGIDDKDVYYLDYLRLNFAIALRNLNVKTLATIDAFLTVHRDTIMHHIQEQKANISELVSLNSDDEKIASQHDVLKKYIWLKDYHNSRVRELNHKGLEDRFIIKD